MLFKLLKIFFTKEFLNFIIIGVLNTLLGLGIIFLFLNIVELNYWYSTLIGNTIAAVFSYYMNKIHTFKYNSSNKLGLIKFFIVVLICYFISFYLGKEIVSLLCSYFNFKLLLFSNDELSVFISMIIYTSTNFMGQKYFVFNKIEI
jgi:putative flippase GtrA